MSRAAAAIVLSVEERSVLGGWARGRSLPMRLVQRARIFTMAAGMQSQDIARQLRVSRPTVQLWRERFLATHWSTRAMARAQGVSEATVRRIWKRHRLKPHLAEPFKLSKDERFYDKLQ
ncbi:IS630 family transposase, partial [candidate division WOR-3 bacterium]|nr:IS630 family transposase [candidate division WOR-3 bacterium]